MSSLSGCASQGYSLLFELVSLQCKQACMHVIDDQISFVQLPVYYSFQVSSFGAKTVSNVFIVKFGCLPLR